MYLKRDGGHEILPVLHAAPAVDDVGQAAAVHVLEDNMDVAILWDTPHHNKGTTKRNQESESDTRRGERDGEGREIDRRGGW